VIRLVLFDIDGTLLDAGGAGRRALARAIEEEVGRSIPQHAFHGFAGRPDSWIVRTILERMGLPDVEPASERRIFDGYTLHLEEELRDRPTLRILPGVRELLDALASEQDFLLGLLTGNIETSARTKLSHLGINATFGFGAFGDDASDRDRLLPIARSRAEERRGGRIDAGQICLVGDTPLDIGCARAGGSSILAVATGLYDAESLAALEPDQLLNDLRDTAEVIRVLRCLTDPRPPHGRRAPHRDGQAGR
jgi:phosphoglycolate phosphatase